MTIPKRFLHDRLILLLLSIQVFLAFIGSIWILFKLGSGHGSGYIVEYRANLGIGAFKTGSVTELAGFIGFLLLVLVVHSVLSVRTYHIKRQLSVFILGLGVILMLLAIIVSNALLVLH